MPVGGTPVNRRNAVFREDKLPALALNLNLRRGISRHDLMVGEIFSTFVQLDQSTTRRHEGLGLGLAISRALARAMSGDLEAESQEGIGTTVTVRLNAATG